MGQMSWGNHMHADELHVQLTLIHVDYWKLSFPLQLAVVTGTTASLAGLIPAGCAKATEDDVVAAVFGILYSLTGTSEGR